MLRKRYNKKNQTFVRKLRFIVDKAFFLLNIAIIILILSFAVKLYNKYSNLLGFGFVSEFYTHQTSKFGLILENIYLEGQQYASTNDIINAVGIKIGESLFKKSPEQIKADLEKISWVKSAIVVRQLPNNLYIGIEERVPVGIGQHNKELFLFDVDGEKINTNNLEDFLNLPVVINEDVNLYVNTLYPLICEDKELYSKISSVIRVGERRWNVRLNDELEIKLPENDIESAWNKVKDLYKSKQLFNEDIVTIDLRVKNRMFVEKKK